MARSARKTAGIPAGAWFAAQSFHQSTETQPRLEGAGPDRVEASPTFAVPFSLTAQADTTPDAVPADLFTDRAAFHALITAPDTGARLDALLEDNRATDARILAERDEELEADWRAEREGEACGSACGYCGRCS